METITTEIERPWSVFHSRLNPEKQIGVHHRDSWELSYVIKGRGERIVGGVTSYFKEGDMVLIVPNMDHGWFFNPTFTDEDGNIECITVMWTTELMIKMAAIFPEWKGVVEKFQSQKQSVLFNPVANEDLLSALYALDREEGIYTITCLIDLIMKTADSLHKGYEKIGVVKLSLLEKRLQEINIYTCCNYARQISIDEIASHVGMNRSAFCTFFKKQTGKTYVSFLNEYRLKVAYHLLTNTDCNISNVCWQCGFNDLAYFDKLFKKAFDISPTEIKRLKTNVNGRNYISKFGKSNY